MKRRDVLKYLPKLATMRHEAEDKLKRGQRLIREGEKTRRIVDSLEGTKLYNGFPLQFLAINQHGMEIFSGCDEVQRSAYVKPINKNSYTVITYQNNSGEIDGTPIEGTFSKKDALVAAQEFVSRGRVEKRKS